MYKTFDSIHFDIYYKAEQVVHGMSLCLLQIARWQRP